MRGKEGREESIEGKNEEGKAKIKKYQQREDKDVKKNNKTEGR